MSKATKQSILILGLILVLTFLAAGYFYMGMKKVEEEKGMVESQLQKSQDREKKAVSDIKNLNDQIQRVTNEKNSIEEKVRVAEAQVEDLVNDVKNVSDEKDKLRSRINEVRKERDDLVARVQDLVAEQNELKAAAAQQQVQEVPRAVPDASGTSPSVQFTVESASDEEYWANVLKEKTAIEVELENLKQELSKNSLDVLELKQKNANLQIKLDGFGAEKDEIIREIKYKEDMINKLSLELARTKNDKKFVKDRVTKLNDENMSLRGQIKQLVATKSALEKSIVRLTQDKTKMEKKLIETENVIQGKIDEIWEIKESLDQTFKSTRMSQPTSSEVELPPIVVSSDGPAVSYAPGETPGYDGKIVSVNDENNFIIVDIGENQGIRLGDMLSVYRGSEYIARLEVIQVRRDIAAADIRDQWSNVQVGDIVR